MDLVYKAAAAPIFRQIVCPKNLSTVELLAAGVWAKVKVKLFNYAEAKAKIVDFRDYMYSPISEALIWSGERQNSPRICAYDAKLKDIYS